MTRALAVLVAGAILTLLVGCAGAYVAGGVGAHKDSGPASLTPPP